MAFRYAVERVNSNRNILPNSLLSAQIEKIPPQDSFHASKRGEIFLLHYTFLQSPKKLQLLDFYYLEYIKLKLFASQAKVTDYL